MIKKAISLFLLITLLFCLSSCKNKKSSNTTTISQENEGIKVSSNSESTYESETTFSTEIKLSDSCDKVLASGYDSENNYYELVANEKEDYSGTKIEIGVIKNNEWNIPLTTDNPFIGENGLLSAYRSDNAVTGSIYDERFAKFYYIGNGCFYYDGDIFNGNNRKYYISDDFGYVPVIFLDNNRTENIINNEGYFILSKYDKTYKILDSNTMNTTEINMHNQNDIDYVFPYSEGLFACMDYNSDIETNGFYNLKGEKVIDLSKYALAENTYNRGPVQSLVFINGKCRFKITNDQGTDYYITIDKTGNVIDSTIA